VSAFLKRGGLLVSVPWPLRLFGDLQDELELPALTMAADLRTAVAATPTEARRWRVDAPWLSSPVTFDPGSQGRQPLELSSLAGTVRALERRGIRFERGFDFKVHTRLPARENLPYSPALTAAWTASLLALHGRLADLSGADVAEIACGALDTGAARMPAAAEVYTCVLGGTLITRHEGRLCALAVERNVPGILLVRPTRRVDTSELVRDVAGETAMALQSMRDRTAGFRLDDAPLSEVVPQLRGLSERHAGIIYALGRGRDVCSQACELVEGEYGFDDDAFGELLDDANEILADYFGFRFPQIDTLINAAKGAGALGCKIIPGGDGLVVFAPGHEEDVIAAVKPVGGTATAVAVSDGMHVEKQ